MQQKGKIQDIYTIDYCTKIQINFTQNMFCSVTGLRINVAVLFSYQLETFWHQQNPIATMGISPYNQSLF